MEGVPVLSREEMDGRLEEIDWTLTERRPPPAIRSTAGMRFLF